MTGMIFRAEGQLFERKKNNQMGAKKNVLYTCRRHSSIQHIELVSVGMIV
jgi:hypothetical protein